MSSDSPASTLVDNSGRANKTSLINAIAAELRREQERTSGVEAMMAETEARVEAQHRILLQVEDAARAKREANDATIAALRKELATARQSLEEATIVNEVDAEEYLSLLGGPLRTPLPSIAIHSLNSGITPLSRSPRSYGAFPLPHTLDAALPSTSSAERTAIPTVARSAAERVALRKARLENQLRDENRGAPRAGQRDVSAGVSSSTYPAAPMATDLEQRQREAETSVWRNSGESGRSVEGYAAELGERKSSWTRFFPGAGNHKRTNSQWM